MPRFTWRLAGLLFAVFAITAGPALAQLDSDPPTLSVLRGKSGLSRLAIDMPAVPPATQRAPRVTDDTTRGFTVGKTWLDETTGRMWSALDVTAGKASWVPIRTSNALPLDGYTAAKFILSTCRQISSYGGPAMTLTRTSDSATRTLQFASDGCVDAADGDDFCTNDPTTCYVTTWNNQVEGETDFTGTPPNAPVWNPLFRINGKRVVSFQSFKHDIAGPSPDPYDQYLTNSSISWTPSHATIAFVMIQNNSKSRADEAGLIAAADYSTGYTQSNDGGGIHGLGTGGDLTISMPASPSVTMIAGGPSFFRAWSRYGYENGSHPTDVGVKTGAVIGYNPTYGGAMMHVASVIGWDSTLSSNATRPTVISALEQFWRIAPQADTIVDVWGASDAGGTASINGASWPIYMLPLLTPGTVLYNDGSHGMTLETAQSYKEIVLGGTYSSSRGAYARNYIVVLTMLLNDIRQGQTLAQLQTNVTNLVTYVKSLRADAKVVVVTRPMPCDFVGNATYIATLQGFNGWVQASYNVPIANGGVGADAYLDQFSNPAVSDSSYVNSGLCPVAASWDNVHLRDGTDHEYQQTVAIQAAPVINGLMQ